MAGGGGGGGKKMKKKTKKQGETIRLVARRWEQSERRSIESG